MTLEQTLRTMVLTTLLVTVPGMTGCGGEKTVVVPGNSSTTNTTIKEQVVVPGPAAAPAKVEVDVTTTQEKASPPIVVEMPAEPGPSTEINIISGSPAPSPAASQF